MPNMRLSRLFLPLLVAAAAGIAGMEAYTRTPQAVSAPVLDLPADVSRLVLIVHGSFDGDNPQFPAIASALAARHGDDPGVVVRYLRWGPWSDLRLRAASSAQRLGSRLGGQLAGLPLARIDLVLHSSGSYTADALCESYRAAAASPARVQMVFLDPFQIGGFVDWSHGARNHGRCADFALSVLNTDDPAPATNRPLRHAFNLDVTAHPAREGYDRNGHYWPVEYFLRFMAGPDGLAEGLSHEQYPRGGMLVAPPEGRSPL
jgi:hypothetical protein